MELREIMEQITAVPLGDGVQVTQLTHEEDGEPYQVWQIDNGDARYILKEAKEKEDEAAGNAAEKQLKDEEDANDENKEQ